MERSAGILLPVFSLPSPHGIGTLGRKAYDFIDFLAAAGQKWWQILPIGPTGYGDSPYQSFSTYAGNPYFIDPDLLEGEGLLTKEEIARFEPEVPADRIDYQELFHKRFALLRLAARRGLARDRAQLDRFSEQNAWVRDYALFMALKDHFGGAAWSRWPDADIRRHRPQAVERYQKLLEEDCLFYAYLQLLFTRQWDDLHTYARGRGIGIIGDLPIYVAPDSADVWAEPQFFDLDADFLPREVAGVPPDAFSDLGQLWGNPLYNWDRMRADGYGWWIRRVDGAGKRFDRIRIDHFRAFHDYWAIPNGLPDARKGRWKKGPGLELVRILQNWFPQLSFIAEDLGDLNDGVRKLVKDSGWPGMKVMEFAFSPGGEFLPHEHRPNAVCYIGTHDNDTLQGWIDSAGRKERAFAEKYLGTTRRGLFGAVMRSGLSSVCGLFIAQMQDYLGLGSEARINSPGTDSGNWVFRLSPGQCTPALAERLCGLMRLYGRFPYEKKEKKEDAAPAG